MVERHRDAGAEAMVAEGPPGHRPADIAGRLGDQPSLVQKLVAFEDQLLVPRSGRQPKGEPKPFLAQPPFGLGRSLGRPPDEAILDPAQRVGLAVAPVLPREIAVPAVPRRIGRTGA